MAQDRETENWMQALNKIPPAVVPYDHPVRESVFSLYQTLRMERAAELLERRREVAEKMRDLTRTLWSFSTIPDEILKEGELKEAEHQLKLTQLELELHDLRTKLKNALTEKEIPKTQRAPAHEHEDETEDSYELQEETKQTATRTPKKKGTR